MAKASWLTVNPASGSGNGTSNFSGSQHTGRNARNTTATFKASGVTDITRTVTQAGKPEFVEIASDISAQKQGQTVTVSGTSNSKKLNFTLGTGALVISLPANYNANSVSTVNNANISGDPGATAQYPFSITVTVPANEGVTALTKQIIVTDNAGHQATCTITLAAGDPVLVVSPDTTIELTWQGTAAPVTIASNTNWTIE
jgi:hypothetical protein